MTTALQIITRAYRESQLVAIVSTPNANEQNEALPLLNSILLSCVGLEAGEELADLNIGGSFDDSACCSTYVPPNVRLILNLGGSKTLKLDPYPYEGQRLAIADVAGNLATDNLILDGNGRKIENVTSLTLSTNGDTRQWLYRADTANWVKITLLETSDDMPFPVEYDDYFIVMLAMRLNPRNGVKLAEESAAMLTRTGQALQARYRRPRPVQDMGTLGLMGNRNGVYGPTSSEFGVGRPRF